ncbi:peptide/nickel transport system substrate-binding protein [Hymenobacter luteus]|uniref:Peptide/nickel transport system substrate-binding protein n=2 Tax=Hymenobacter TaxID=89966 RepID=A0A7W9SXZ7_9BACT|nr:MULTISPECIES: ABC transporter substrate-binding protein [Hymenobacter]MBB4600152.1 peptide/nickel transport system substrate-binding protein [Hymenobacter latericoloratus]MBB6057538.1 peptide/nickel transport system substrate-binding protein [Hymenobacter luteus]
MKQILFGLVLLVWAGLGLSACSPTTTATSAETIRIRWARDPDNLDPLLVDNPSAFEVTNLLHCSLLKGNEAQNRFVPWLAEAQPTTRPLGDSLLLVTYRLRPQATWDNGSPVLARDVAFTLKVMNCPGLPIERDQATFGFIRNIQLDAHDPRQFTLVCAGQSGDRVSISGDFSILPEYVLDPRGTLRTVPLPQLALPRFQSVAQAFARRYQALNLARHPERLPGCGAYTLTAWQPGRYLTLRRKARWWADSLPAPPPELQAFPPQLTYQVIPDATTATMALRRGEIDLYALMPAAEFARLQHASPDQTSLRFYTTNSYEFLTANFNVRRPALRDALTRQALTYLFDIPALIRATQQGAASPSAGPISPRIARYYNDSLPLPSFSPARAAALLRQARWQRQPDGSWQRQGAQATTERLQLTISYRAGEPSFETVALQFRSAALALGIPVQLHPTEQSLLSRQLRAGEYDMNIRQLAGNPFSYDFTSLLHSRGIGNGNTTGFSTPQTDRLIEAIPLATSPAEKARLLRKFQRALAYERPFSVLYFMRYRVAASRRLGVVPVMGLVPGYEASRIRLEKKPTTR